MEPIAIIVIAIALLILQLQINKKERPITIILDLTELMESCKTKGETVDASEKLILEVKRIAENRIKELDE